MLKAQSIPFTAKLFAGILLILVLSTATVITVTTVDVRKGLMDLGRSAVENMSVAVFNSLGAQNSLLLEKLSADLTIL